MNLQIPAIPKEREIFCNRTLNLNAIKAIGYDLDYTLVHYDVEAWEERAYAYVREELARQGWPVDHLQFDMESVCRGLVIDLELGNLLKANRFGYVKSAQHGTRKLDFPEMRSAYLKTLVDLKASRYVFLETLFAISEACIFVQLVDLFDAEKLPHGEVRTYADLYKKVRNTLNQTHMEGILKAEIMADPGRFVQRDPEVALALLDQRSAGKKLILVTNSDWRYASAMLNYAIDPFLPDGKTWRDLFHLTIVDARKPDFFTARTPLYEIVSEDGLLRAVNGPVKEGGIYTGGNVAVVESFLGHGGDSILYVGDHIFADVMISKTSKEWRTAMIVREIEDEVRLLSERRELNRLLSQKMAEKEAIERERDQCRMLLQRILAGYDASGSSADEVKKRMELLRSRFEALDAEVAPLAIEAGKGTNPNWGYLMRTGNDKSLLTRRIETFADLYTSRVSNFFHATPFRYFRSHRASMPHDDL